MTDSARITAIETRMDELVEEVANLKIQTSVIGTMQVAEKTPLPTPMVKKPEQKRHRQVEIAMRCESASKLTSRR